MAHALGRILFALAGAALSAVIVAILEAWQVAAASTGAHAPGFVALVAADVGVLAPIAMALGAGVAAASLFFEPARQRGLRERLAAVRAQPSLARSRAAAMALMASVFATVWLLVTAHAARAALSRGSAMAAGGALALTSLACLIGCGVVGLALLARVSSLLASGAARWPRAIDPITVGVFGAALGIAAVGLGVATGDTGGGGQGALAIFGVLKRTELDLRPVFYLAAMAACAWLAPLALAGHPPRPVAAAIALAIALVPLGITARDASALERDAAPAVALERAAPLGRMGLSLARRATDRDHDGASPYFGGGDCNDADPNISPLAVDIPGNGIDEDCSGADLPLPAKTADDDDDSVTAAAAAGAIGADDNLVLITVDTLRAGEMGFLGYDKPTTPNLDRLAAESVVFDDAYSMASYTGKALAPMLIGKYPSETYRDGGHFNRYFERNTFIAERLRAAGFFTMGAASHPYFRPHSGVTQGFDTFDLSAIPAGARGDTDATTTARQLTDAAERLLERHARGQRFFLWVHYFDPHAQYVAHAGAPDFSDPAHPPGWRARAAYDGEVWFTDEQIGRLLDYARAQPWWKTTVVAVTSDHGEALGEHGMKSEHGFEVWEPLMRIPLLFRVPTLRPHHVPVKRSAVDIVPTLLDLMRLPRPAHGELSGRSLLPDLRVGAGDRYEERDVYIDMPDGPYTHMRRGIIHGPTPGMKLIHFGGRQYQLYDLAVDPGEREDLASDRAKLRPMLAALQAKRATLKEVYVKADAPAAP